MNAERAPGTLLAYTSQTVPVQAPSRTYGGTFEPTPYWGLPLERASSNGGRAKWGKRL